MSDHLTERDDFEASIYMYTEAEGGYKNPIFNGIFLDFVYAESDLTSQQYWIYPDFIDENRNSYSRELQILPGSEHLARMFILSDEFRMKVHRDKIAIGVKFYCHEGNRRMGEGIITKITGLFLNRDYNDTE